MTSVLLVDDGRAYASEVAVRLADELGTDVRYEDDPSRAVRRIAAGGLNAVVVDVLFRPVTEIFERKRQAGEVSAADGPFLVSGLAVLQAARYAKVPAVVWTDGGDDRLLHMRYAYDEFGTRVFCRKDELGLAAAVRTAISGGTVIPRSLVDEGLGPDHNRVADSLFHRRHWARVWRILAIGDATTHKEVTRAAEGSFTYTPKDAGEMALEAANLHAFTRPGKNPLNFCHRFASKNAFFLLDDTIHERHP
jgi:hypothetical protein